MILQRDPHGFRAEINYLRTLVGTFNVDTRTENNLTSSFKHMLFLEFILNTTPTISYKTFLKSIIYDVLSSIISILNKRERYLQLNIRSMVEHLARISLQKVDNGGDFDITIRLADFEFLKSNNTIESWNYLHQQYTQACSWLHSSSKVKLNISASFADLLEEDTKTSMAKQSTHLNTVTSEIVKASFNYYFNEINNAFFRSKREMKFLVGKNNFEQFSKINIV